MTASASSMGRAIWQTDAALPNARSETSTHTIYNALGETIETDKYQGAVISIVNAAAPGSGLVSSLQSAGNWLSASQSWYDESGRVIETADSAGLRTGTIYYPNGQVQYTGPLNYSAPDGGEIQVDSVSGLQVHKFSLGDFAYTTHNLYDQFDGTEQSRQNDASQLIETTSLTGERVGYVCDGRGISDLADAKATSSIDENGDAAADHASWVTAHLAERYLASATTSPSTKTR